MKAFAKSRLLAGILCILLLCTTVPSTTSCESAVGSGALVVAVIAVVLVSYVVITLSQWDQDGMTTSACVDPHLASIRTELPKLIEQQQDFVISNELDCPYQVYVDSEYRCDVGPLATTSLKAGIGAHDATLYRLAGSNSPSDAPLELRKQFEVVDDESFAFAVVQYSY